MALPPPGLETSQCSRALQPEAALGAGKGQRCCGVGEGGVVGTTLRSWDETWSIPGIGASQLSAACGDISALEKKLGHSQDGDTGTRRGLRTPRPAHTAHQDLQAERLKATTVIISAFNWGHWAEVGAMAVSLEEPFPTQPPARAGHRSGGGCREPTGTRWWQTERGET